MAYQKLADLAEKLSLKTQLGEIDWEETTEKGVYQASFSDYSVTISTLNREESQVLVRIFNDEGSLIEEFTDDDLFIFIPNNDGQYFYKIMKETFEIARRHALGTEQVINKILAELDKDDLPF